MLATADLTPEQRVFSIAVAQGLSSERDAFPDVPTVADMRRLRLLLPKVWVKIPAEERMAIYEVIFQTTPTSLPHWRTWAGIPKGISAAVKIYRREGVEGMRRYTFGLATEMEAFRQEVASLWENEQAVFQSRVENAAAEAVVHRGQPLRTKNDVKAALDELF